MNYFMMIIECSNDDEQNFDPSIFTDLNDESPKNGVFVDADEVNKYINNDLSDETKTAIQTKFTEQFNRTKLTEEDLSKIDINKLMEYIKKLELENSYNILKESTVNMTEQLKEKIIEGIDDENTTLKEYISQVPVLTYEPFDTNNPAHLLIIREAALRKDVRTYNPVELSSNGSSIEENAKKSNTQAGYYMCYNKEKQLVGFFSIYNTSSGGDSWSFFFVVSSKFTRKKYGTAIILCVLSQLASLSINNLIECKYVFSLVDTDNEASMSIMQKINKDKLFSGYFARKMNTAKFDLTALYSVIKNILNENKEFFSHKPSSDTNETVSTEEILNNNTNESTNNN